MSVCFQGWQGVTLGVSSLGGGWSSLYWPWYQRQLGTCLSSPEVWNQNFFSKRINKRFCSPEPKVLEIFFQSSSLLMKSQSLLWTFYIFIISLELQSQFQSKLIWEILQWRSSQWTVFKLRATLPSKWVANVHILKLLKTSWNISQKLWRIFFRAKYQVILKPISWTSLTMDDWSLLSYEFLGVGRGIQWGIRKFILEMIIKTFKNDLYFQEPGGRKQIHTFNDGCQLH